MVQVQLLFGTGTAHIEQAALFFHLLVHLGARHGCRCTNQREDFFVATGDMHRIEFQTLRHVNRHERHLALGIVHLLVRIGQKRNILQEGIECRTRMFFVKFADGVHHFVQVTDAFVCSEFIFFAQEFLVAHFVDDTFGKNRERSFPCGKQGLPALHQVRKAFELNGRTASAVDFGEQVVPEGAFAVAFTFENVFDSRLADCTRRSQNRMPPKMTDGIRRSFSAFSKARDCAFVR